MVQIATNLLHVCFIIRRELGLEEKSPFYFDYLFLGCLYLVIKVSIGIIFYFTKIKIFTKY
jgi:hypothetical protein